MLFSAVTEVDLLEHAVRTGDDGAEETHIVSDCPCTFCCALVAFLPSVRRTLRRSFARPALSGRRGTVGSWPGDILVVIFESCILFCCQFQYDAARKQRAEYHYK